MRVYLGVHVSRSYHHFTFCLLDESLAICALEIGLPPEILGYASGNDVACIALDSPSNVSRNLMQHGEIRQSFSLSADTKRFTNLRVGEYELIRKKIKVTRTPPTQVACPDWIRKGFALYQEVHALGFLPFPTMGALRQWLEVPCEAAYHFILGRELLDPSSLEGRIQRQLILRSLEVQVPDPMDAFEEITRHRMVHGIFPFKSIYSSSQLSALVSAYTAWLAEKQPEKLVSIGYLDEGLMTVPIQLIMDNPQFESP